MGIAGKGEKTVKWQPANLLPVKPVYPKLNMHK
jgi:hypothetical protein